MEGSTKSKSRCILQLGILLNLTLTLLAVGYLTYKVHTLDERVVRLEMRNNPFEKSTNDEAHKSRRPRAANSSSAEKSSESCTKCRDLCFQLFSQDSRSKKNLQPLTSGKSHTCIRGAPGPQGPTGPRGRRGKRGKQGYRGFPGKRGPVGMTGPRGHRGFPGRAFSGNRSVLIDSLDIPKITKRPSSALVVKEGQNTVIPCEASGFPAPEITWYKGEEQVDRKFYKDGSLRFTNVAFENSGRYICNARNFIGHAEASFQLIVNVRPRFLVTPPVFYPGYESWDTTITCNIFGYPTPRIEWTRALQQMPKGRYIKSGKNLVIKKTRQDDKGPYMCKGSNKHGSVFALIVLTVHPVLPPDIVKSPPITFTVRKIHTEVKLICSARGSPLPTVEWWKDGKSLSATNATVSKNEVETTGQLVIQSFEPEDQGSYTCFFKNYDNGTAERKMRIELVLCGDPGTPDHGYRRGNEYWAGKMVIYACDPGYHLDGPSNRICLPSGNWSNYIPTCHRMCPEPVVPQNGYIVGEEFWEGKTIEFQCRAGYWLMGASRITCDNTTGNWTDSEPECKGHTLHSDILTNQTEYYMKLREWLAPVTNLPTKWGRCYYTKEHGWASSTFHSKCNSLGPTITLIRVKEYIFGGYTDISWHSNGAYSSSSNSFLFSFNNFEGLEPFKMIVFRMDNAIYGNGGYGPTFGGHDIYISNNANSNTNSYLNLGHSYMQLRGYKYGSTEVRKLLAGSYNFRPEEIEVFYQRNE